MLITGSVAAVLALAAIALLYFRRVTAGSGLVVWLSGFTAAAVPGVAGPVNTLLTALVHAISH